jgi:hypothetical protein
METLLKLWDPSPHSSKQRNQIVRRRIKKV